MTKSNPTDSFLGKYLLVGLNYLDENDELERQEQMHGRIVEVSAKGIVLELGGERAGETWNMPPDTSPFEKAAPGHYKLNKSGEEIENPDYLVFWTVRKSSEPEG